MINEELESVSEELQEMYEEPMKIKVLNSDTFKEPVQNLKLKEAMYVEEGTSVSEAIKIMQENHIGCILITKKGILSGIFTERDVLNRIVGFGKDLNKTKIEEVMTAGPENFPIHTSIAHILNAMHIGGKRHVIIVDENKHPTAVVSVKDIVEFIVEHFSEEVLNVPPRPIVKTEQREGA
jgi:CBS domain-containing protein